MVSRCLFPLAVRGALLIGALTPGCGPGATPEALPTFGEDSLLLDAEPVPLATLDALGGVYSVTEGSSAFGNPVVVQVVRDKASVLGEPNAIYAVLDTGCRQDGSELVLEGAYRRASDGEVGLVRLLAGPPERARAMCSGQPASGPETLAGAYGTGSASPREQLTFEFDHAERDPEGRFFVVAHRGGCRTIDACGASENSVEVIRLAESLGADAVEIDVRLTRDGVPILYHDDAFGPRLTNGTYCRGAVDEFDLVHVRALCELEGGEPVPTLEEALRAVLDDTGLRGVWLDVKAPDAIAPALSVATRYVELAEATGRTLAIAVGLATSDLADAYARLPAPTRTTCLLELESSDLDRLGCRIWAPRWTRGLLVGEAEAVQRSGGLVAYWTLDDPEFIDLFLRDGRPNAILTNRPGLVRQRFEVLGTVPPAAQWP